MKDRGNVHTRICSNAVSWDVNSNGAPFETADKQTQLTQKEFTKEEFIKINRHSGT